jgi:hypothetical protein
MKERRAVVGAAKFNVVMVLFAAVLCGACNKAESTKAELMAAHLEWDGRVAAIRAQNAELAARVAALKGAGSSDEGALADPTRNHLQALVGANDQSLADLEIAERQIDDEVMKANRPSEALDEARLRMANDLHAQEVALASTSEELAGAARRHVTAAGTNGDQQ